MAEVLITVIGASIVSPVVVFVIKVLEQRLVKPPEPDGPAPIVGTPVQATDWSERAYQSKLRELADEKREHDVCHQIMRGHGIEPPPDHDHD